MKAIRNFISHNEIPPDPKTLGALSETERERFAEQVVVTDDHVDYTL